MREGPLTRERVSEMVERFKREVEVTEAANPARIAAAPRFPDRPAFEAMQFDSPNLWLHLRDRQPQPNDPKRPRQRLWGQFGDAG